MKNKYVNNVLFDFDGTLVDPRKRLYTLFIELSRSNIDFNEYWKLKKEGLNQRQMLEHIKYGSSCEEFSKKWLDEIERLDLLSLDRILDDVKPTLTVLRNREIKLHIITNRRSFVNLEWELHYLGIRRFFDIVLTTCQKHSKDEVIIDSGIDLTEAIFVGDSREDMDTAKKLGIDKVLIHRESDSFQRSIEADYCISNLYELRGILS